MEKDWRLVDQQKYLWKVQLKRQRFKASAQLDHVHCAFCWEKISQNEGFVKEGYCTLDGRFWICDQCFQDFQETFMWTETT